jgi:hypothetical protein
MNYLRFAFGWTVAAILVACSSDAFVTGDAGADAAPDAGACTVLYVSQTGGDDRATGCDPQAPKRTIGSALTAIALATSAPPTEVHVCRGRYEENVVVKGPVKLLGGFDCAAFGRPSDYGYPTFNANVLTEIVRSAVTGPGDLGTVDVRDGGTLDGFAVSAQASSCGAAAIWLATGTSSVSNVRAIGGQGTGACARGSVGIFASGTTATLSKVRVGGGSGSVDGVGRGSTALVVATGAVVTLDTSTLDAGSGASVGGIGSVGLDVAGNVKLVGVAIQGGIGKSDGTSSADSIGVLAGTGGAVEMTASYVYGGAGGTCSLGGGLCRRVGVNGFGGSTLVLRRNRIHGGDAAGTTGTSTAISIDSGAGHVVENNDVVAGTSATTMTLGLALRSSAEAKVRFNTFSSGRPPQTNEARRLVQLEKPGPVTFEGNLFLGFGANVVAFAHDCPVPTTATVSENAFAGISTFVQPLSTCGSAAVTLSAFEATPTIGATLPTKNVVLQPSCAQAGCIALDHAQLHQPFSPVDGGSSELADGWKLPSNVSCSFTNGVVLAAPPTTDLFGAPRTKPSTYGAFEQDQCK